MAVLTADRDTQVILKPGLKGYLVKASTTIYKGGMVMLTGGYLEMAADTTGSLVVGVADEHVDNSAGADGAKKCRVRSGEIYDFAASSIAITSLGVKMFVVDDQTFDETTPLNNVVAGTLVEYISTTRGKIYIPVEHAH